MTVANWVWLVGAVAWGVALVAWFRTPFVMNKQVCVNVMIGAGVVMILAVLGAWLRGVP